VGGDVPSLLPSGAGRAFSNRGVQNISADRGECGPRRFIGTQSYYLRAIAPQRLYCGVERYDTSLRDSSFKGEDEDEIEAGRQVRVVGGIDSAVHVTTAFDGNRRRHARSRATGRDRINQRGSSGSVENVSLATLGINCDCEESALRPRRRKLRGDLFAPF
jgi:hypothetical protein